MTGVPSREVIFLQIPSWTAKVLAGFLAVSVVALASSGQAAMAQPSMRVGLTAQPTARFQVRSPAQLAVAMRPTLSLSAFFAPVALPTSSTIVLNIPNTAVSKPSTSSLIDFAGSKAAAQVVARSSRSSNAVVVRSTAYNSLAAQTDRTPHITATGARTRFGVVALSRDLLRQIPYGSQVRITDLGQWGSGKNRGQYNGTLSEMLFVVEDTMHQRKRQQIDVWFPSYRAAVRWGVRQVRLEVVRYGRSRY
jgi:3D (Asp-Asp-Asp) domain-containing protein